MTRIALLTQCPGSLSRSPSISSTELTLIVPQWLGNWTQMKAYRVRSFILIL
jgi:hypothetical protein